MKSVDALLDAADELMEQGEEKITVNINVGFQVFQQAIGNMFKAYLITNRQEPLGELKALFFQCQKLNEEFEAIADVVDIFINPALNETDGETITDAANEIWDFVMELLPMVEEEL
jgi:frataxin-like iron-binding protein CyaY